MKDTLELSDDERKKGGKDERCIYYSNTMEARIVTKYKPD
jgi:hypothetical protein